MFLSLTWTHCKKKKKNLCNDQVFLFRLQDTQTEIINLSEIEFVPVLCSAMNFFDMSHSAKCCLMDVYESKHAGGYEFVVNV